jgi:biopolymer transport protein ExbD
MAFRVPAPDEAPSGGDEDASLFAEINITPLTDVILVLLIIFMVSSTAMVEAVRQSRLDVELPKADAAASSKAEADVLVLAIEKNGVLVLEGKPVTEDQLVTALMAQHAADPKKPIIIAADGELQHRSVVHLVDVARRVGFEDVGIGIEQTGR